jgi:hypothetical protein
MIEQLRRILSTPAGKILAIVLTGGLIAFGFYQVSSFFKGETPDTAFYTVYVDSETGQWFKHEKKIGDVPPIYSPFSKKNDAYAAEACYWTPDGGTKKDPDWVPLNETIQKPGPTFCPVCGRLVVGHNPEPQPNRKAPPTKAEWLERHPGASAGG